MSEMLEKILSEENIRLAQKKVYSNKGARGRLFSPYSIELCSKIFYINVIVEMLWNVWYNGVDE